MTDQPDTSDTDQDTPTTCGDARELTTPAGPIRVVCSREPSHAQDHFDEVAGIAWPNESEGLPAMLEAAVEVVAAAFAAAHVAESRGDAVATGEYFASLALERVEVARTHAALDRLGVPRSRNDVTHSLVQRLNLFVDRLSRRLYGQVENNMVYYRTIKDVLTLLEGAPNSSQFRIKQSIAKLRAVLPAKTTPAGIHLQ
jgi:hypothetical protein